MLQLVWFRQHLDRVLKDKKVLVNQQPELCREIKEA
jgi:hypothetical protein